MRNFLAALATAALSGCTLTTEWRGDPGFLLEGTRSANAAEPSTDPTAAWEVGRTTLREVLRDVGPPDEILRRGRELWLVYRYRYRKARELRLVAYGGQFFRWYDGKDVDSMVVVALDPEDRLLYVGRGRYAGDRGVLGVLLDR
ncbi:MAG: hypothetical protein D6731_16175 [Planctomycetota bacterium]|nr:MAG: hypothetical protein D6731_16175 [Planctomycetota bacterium]